MVNIEVQISAAAKRDIDKYGYKTRKLKTTHARISLRERKKRVSNPRTQAEIKALVARRHELREQIKKAIAEGHDKIAEIARELFETYGTHNFDWWYMALLQCSIKFKKRRKTTTWNAWLFLWRKKRRIGAFSFPSSQKFNKTIDRGPAKTQGAPTGATGSPGVAENDKARTRRSHQGRGDRARREKGYANFGPAQRSHGRLPRRPHVARPNQDSGTYASNFPPTRSISPSLRWKNWRRGRTRRV